MRRAIPVLVASAALLAAGACRRSGPVAGLAVEPTTVDLPHPLAVPLRFRWTPAAPLDGLQGRPRVFVHVLDGGRRLLRTFDHPLPEAWTPGRPQSYEIELYQSAIAEKLAPGAYELTFGLYDDAGKRRWPLSVDGEEVGRREYRLGSLVVPAAETPSPSFQMTGEWQPVEPGSSKQVVARRCLSGEGRIAVGAPPSPGTVRVAASIMNAPASPPPGSAWTISASCAPETAEISRPELQWVGFRIAPSADAPPCEIRFAPPSAGNSARTLCLEVLSWRPSAP